MSDQIRQCPVCEEWFEVNPGIRGQRRDRARFCSRKCVARWRTESKRREWWKGATPGSVPLGGGLFAMVDIEEWDRCKDRTWRASTVHGGQVYAVAISGRKATYLHRFIMGEPNCEVDHINLNRLDCRKSNLRLASRMEQSGNTPIRSDNTSGYKGVSLHKGMGKWRATIQKRTIGYFNDAISAAKAYDDEARRVFGEFARVNFPSDSERGCRV